jgi:hypothetical protein
MKKYILISCVLVFSFLSCSEDFLDKYPTTDISEPVFFNSIKDLETYTNGFYDYMSASSRDYSTDDQTRYSEGDQLASKLKGLMTSSNSGSWSWSSLRNVNYFLDKYKKVVGPEADINHFVGFARYTRARIYIGKIKANGMAPWYDKPLETSDEELLYKGHDTREFVVNKIMEDLEFAAEHCYANTSREKISKWAVLSEISRFCLYEGSYRKYHTELGLSDYNSFFTKAADASMQLMNSNKYAIYSTGKIDKDYNDLFKSEDLSSNPEVILQLDFDKTLGKTHGVVVDYYWGLTKSLADSYLMTDGTKFTDVTNFDKKTYSEVFANRDPRMKQTFMSPGYIKPNTTSELLVRATYGGYTQQKFLHDDKDNSQWDAPTDMALYRYAEILLNYAEAKAELGTITQTDIDKTIKLIRNRVNIPNLNMTAANVNPDAIQASYYPNVTGANKGVILEIRRERRIELACEGFRETDMYRWACGTTLAKAQFGMYVPAFGGIDVTGDGTPDIAILNSPTETGPIAALPNKDSLIKYYLSDGGFYLTEGDHGFIGMNSDISLPKSFIEPKYYYYPIPNSAIVVNPNLTQPPGW